MAGRIAVRDPGLLGQVVDFTLPDLHGYRYAGPPLQFTVAEGGSERIEVVRENVAERLYRSTGRGAGPFARTIRRPTFCTGRWGPCSATT
mgnify:CR=1 FL=1